MLCGLENSEDMRATEGPRLALGEIQSLNCFISAQGLEKEKEGGWRKKGRRKEGKENYDHHRYYMPNMLFV